MSRRKKPDKLHEQRDDEGYTWQGIIREPSNQKRPVASIELSREPSLAGPEMEAILASF